MPEDLHDLDEAITRIEGLAIRTTQGSFVRMEDVRRLLEEERDREPEAKPQPKTVVQAREAVKRDPEIMKHFKRDPREPGRSINAA